MPGNTQFRDETADVFGEVRTRRILVLIGGFVLCGALFDVNHTQR